MTFWELCIVYPGMWTPKQSNVDLKSYIHRGKITELE